VGTKRPFSFTLERATDPPGMGISKANDGAITDNYGLTQFGDDLNAILDRVTGGYIYGDEATQVVGTVAKRADKQGHPYLVLVDRKGGEYVLQGYGAAEVVAGDRVSVRGFAVPATESTPPTLVALPGVQKLQPSEGLTERVKQAVER
jgi:hypothetical protein